MKRKLLLIVFAVISIMASCQDHQIDVPYTFKDDVTFEKGIWLGGVYYDHLPTGGVSMVYPGLGIAVSTGSGWGPSIVNNSNNWNAAYLWGNHAAQGYLKSFTETDPVFNASPAKGITAADIANWRSPSIQLKDAIPGLDYLEPPQKTTVEINALVIPVGHIGIVWDKTTGELKLWNGTMWKRYPTAN